MPVVSAQALAPNKLLIRIEAGKILTEGHIIDYAAEPGDVVYNGRDVVRNGIDIGRLVGEAQTLLSTYDTYLAEPLPADLFAGWQVSGNTVRDVFRKTHVVDTAELIQFTFGYVVETGITLDLATPLSIGQTVTITLPGTLGSIAYTHAPASTPSEAIHLSQTGFRPDDTRKIGYLSTWAGADAQGNQLALHYAAGTPFQVVEEGTGLVVFRGTLRDGKPASEPTDWTFNHTKADVAEADFSALTRPGSYHLIVDGVGTSPYSFTIDNDVWDRAATTSLSGLYAQRSGIALVDPYADIARPRDLHPDDGLVVHRTTITLAQTTEGLNLDGGRDHFGDIVAGATSEVVANAWGGWHDAGDFDRRIQHTDVVRDLFYLAEIRPGWVERTALDIPENGNDIPDILDEALWGLDVFRRLQDADGGVSGGLESSGNPARGQGSWNDTNDWYAYTPDLWSTAKYAASAAKAAFTLRQYDAALATIYEDSAVRAMGWVEAHQDQFPTTAADYKRNEFTDSRNLAAAELYRLTGDARYNGIYLATTVFNGSAAIDERQYEAADVYARTSRAGVDQAVQQRGVDEILANADFILNVFDRGGFGSLYNPWTTVGWGISEATPIWSERLIRAHGLQPDAAKRQDYLDHIIDDTQYGLGANPLNQTYTTGIGERQPTDILQEDYESQGGAYPDGISVYGTYNPASFHGYYWYFGYLGDNVFPNFYDRPIDETSQGSRYLIPLNEFTPQQTIGVNALVWSWLAARDAGDATPETGPGNADTAQGGGGGDLLATGLGRDTLMGSAGDDSLNGGPGDDMLQGGAGADTLYGGAGRDTASYAGATSGVTVSLATQRETGGDVLFAIENLRGSAHDDSLTGDDGDNVLDGHGGNDTLAGGAGDDTAVFDSAASLRLVIRPGGFDALVTPDGGGPAARSLMTGIEWLRTADSTLALDAGLTGFFKVTDTAGNQLAPGTAYAGPVAGVARQFLGSAAGEAVAGTAGHDFINLLNGDDAADGGPGDDIIDGGLGSNFLTGGAGRDIFFLDARGNGQAITWSTITDWADGEQLAIFGVKQGISRATWLASDGTAGFQGATLHLDIDGHGGIDTSVTWSGRSIASLPLPTALPELLWFQ